MSLLSKIFGDANEKYIRSLGPIVVKVNGLEPELRALSDADLKSKTAQFRERLANGEMLDNILPEAFAAVREASRRTLEKRHFDVQLIGGIVLHQGKIAEMKTGEGKTLVATLPAYLNALTGHGVHIVTVNDYLSRRDAVWMGQIYNALGLTVGVINHEASYLYDEHHSEIKNEKIKPVRMDIRPGGIQNDSDRIESPRQSRDNAKSENDQKNAVLDTERDTEGGFRIVHEFLRPVMRTQAYAADITYGTNNEFGFDYLRDNMVYAVDQMAQRPSVERGNTEAGRPNVRAERTHNFAIVDEVDSILIDEARTPLIISAPDTESTKLYETFARVVPALKSDEDYTVDEKFKAVSITDNGIEKVEKRLGMKNIYDQGGVRYVHHLEQALKAQVLFKRDKDYVVKDGEVIIVDEFTGRMMPGRRWSEGLHQAVEAKEGVKIQKESRTLATITFQNYFRLYDKLAGMTGTAKTSAEEFHKVYNLDVVVVPTNKPLIRADAPDRIYKTEMGKFRAVAREIRERHEKGQPVLIGTVSIAKNELLSVLLEREGVPHHILNAKNHEKEAEIIAQAGQAGAVTVATNMAGRGVDIVLGGNPQNDPDEIQRVTEAGGLHVIGTERHEARRIDDQLRGRSGRQGDPGSSQFFVSTEDELVRIFGGDRLKNIMERLGVGEEDAIENRLVSNAIQQAQARIEGHNFDLRKYVLEYDDVMNKHREAIYGLRRRVLSEADSGAIILEYLDETLSHLVQMHTAIETGEPADAAKTLAAALRTIAPLGADLESKLTEWTGNPEAMTGYITGALHDLYNAKEKEVGESAMRNLERAVLLRTIDELWMDHIDAMEYLRDSVRLRAYGQRDPLAEYKVEGQNLFEQLMDAIKSGVTAMIFKVGFVQAPPSIKLREQRPDVSGEKPLQQRDVESAGYEHHAIQPHSDTPKLGLSTAPKTGRNDPCFCGSGKKYKKCHGQ